MTVQIAPGVVRTYVGAKDVRFTATTTVEPVGAAVTLEWASSDPALCPIGGTGTCREIGRLGKATVTVRVRDAGGAVVAEDEALVLSEVERVLDTDDSVLDLSRGSTGGRVLAGGEARESLLTSDDAGATWTGVSGVPIRFSILDVVHSAADPALAAVSAVERPPFAGPSMESALFLSEDGGRTWRALTDPEEGSRKEHFYGVVGVAFHPTDRQALHVVTHVYSGDAKWRVYRSGDLGASWDLTAEVLGRGPMPPTFLIDPTDPDRMYLGANGSLIHEGGYTSADGGATWSDWPAGAPESVLGIDAAGRLYGRRFTGETTYSPQQLVRSSDHGRTWEVLLEEAERSVALLSTLGRDVVAVGLNRSTNAGHVVRISFDGGGTWDTIPLSPADRTSFSRPNVLELVAYDGGVATMVLSVGERSHHEDPGQLWKLLYHRVDD